jgi:hypothetical protein
MLNELDNYSNIANNSIITNGIANLLGLPEAVVTSIPTVYKAYKQQRIFNFLKYADFTIDRISVNDCNKIRKLVSSDEGKILLCKYLEEAIAIDSEVARMALAILFNDDPDFIFESHVKNIIFIAIKELDDRAINFYIDAHNKVHNYKIDGLPYERVVINSESELLSESWTNEDIALLIGHFRKLNLLLPDPCSSSPYSSKDSTWLVEYGISDTTKKISRLFQKAKEFSKDYNQ